MSTLLVIGGPALRAAALPALALLLVTPSVVRADTFRVAADTSCLAGGTTTTTSTSSTLLASRIATRSTTEPTLEPTTTTSTATAPGSATYREGKCRNGTATGYYDLWDPVAAAS